MGSRQTGKFRGEDFFLPIFYLSQTVQVGGLGIVDFLDFNCFCLSGGKG